VGEGDLREVHLPGDGWNRLVEQVEYGPLRELGGAARQIVLDVAERRAGEQVEAVRERLGQRRAEEAVPDRERLVEPVVEGQVALVVEAHRAAAGRVAGIDVGGREAVHRAVVPLAVRAVPGMIEVSAVEVAGLMYSSDWTTDRAAQMRVRR